MRQSLAGGRRALDPQLDPTRAPLKKPYKTLCFRGAPSGIPLAAAAPRKRIFRFPKNLTVSPKPLLNLVKMKNFTRLLEVPDRAAAGRVMCPDAEKKMWEVNVRNKISPPCPPFVKKSYQVLKHVNVENSPTRPLWTRPTCHSANFLWAGAGGPRKTLILQGLLPPG